MKAWMEKVTLNQRLALTAILFGAFALLGGTPQNDHVAKVNLRELAIEVDKTTDHVDVMELADWIIKGKADFRLLDLRSEKEYADYHIPQAENVSLAGLSDYPLLRNEKILLYSGGGIHSAQAWFLLKSRGYKGVYILMGGLEEWQDRILFPKLPENADQRELAAFEKTKNVSLHFGGQPQTGISELRPKMTVTLPKMENPSGGNKPATGKKKKKEGC